MLRVSFFFFFKCPSRWVLTGCMTIKGDQLMERFGRSWVEYMRSAQAKDLNP